MANVGAFLCLVAVLNNDVPFYIGDFKIPSIKKEDQKCLGKLLLFSGKAEDTFKLFKNTFKEGLERIDSSSVRSEYKL